MDEQDKKPKYKTMSPRAAVRTVAVGLTLIAAGFTIGLIHSNGSGPGYVWISSWYDVTIQSAPRGGTPMNVQRGYQIICVVIIIGIIFSAIGTASYFQNMNSDK